jgi:lipoprotein-releasing system permease protein
MAMYKLLLCLRYLRTRYIALASIVSVMLGVATMIVVNSVMSGFQSEMYKRLHGILSDVVVEAQSMEGIPDPRTLEAEIRHVLGSDLAGLTSTVHIPSMLSYQYRGQWITKQINLIGIDQQTYADVSDFSRFLLHPANREKLQFNLRERDYDKRLREAGWHYRRLRVAQERFYRQQMEAIERQRHEYELAAAQESLSVPDQASGEAAAVADNAQPDDAPPPLNSSEDPFAAVKAADEAPDEGVGEGAEFDPSVDQHVGVVLGIATSSIRHRTAEGNVVEVFLCRPGDDVKVTFPTAGTPPEAVSANLTVVDFYESKMSEYDAGFAFVPIEHLQYLRGMIDPQTGVASVTSIQIKLRRGADLNAARDKLRSRFPAELFPYRIQTWKDMQGPLLAAVQMETTILNILLFLIIAVAGFGILATFFMIVVEKTRDIGILKALGATRRGVMSIFLGYGLSLGCVGSGVGMVLGLLFVTNINRIAAGLESITGREVFDPTIYYFQEIPTIISPATVAWIVSGAMLIAVLASVLPALRAARMHPVEALRYE